MHCDGFEFPLVTFNKSQLTKPSPFLNVTWGAQNLGVFSDCRSTESARVTIK